MRIGPQCKMKVVSWNINGLRATLKNVSGQDLKTLLDELGADIICFQETKATRDQLDESLYLVDGYNAYFSFSQKRKGYSGVVTFCRNSATAVAAEEGLTGILSSGSQTNIKGYGDHSHFTDDELTSLDSEGRAVLTEHCFTGLGVKEGEGEEKRGEGEERRMVIVNVYCPMYDPARDEKGEGLSRLTFKLNFYRLLEARCSALEREGKVVLAVGDFNCSREPLDSAFAVDASTPDTDNPSRDWIRHFATSLPPPSQPSISPTTTTTSPMLLDTFRHLHPTKAGAYTCWCTRLDARKTNYGSRIDYILASFCLVSKLSRAEVWQDRKGSDHCPVFAEFDLQFLCHRDRSLPTLCSCWFSGRQSKLLDFMPSKGGVASPRGAKRASPPSPKPLPAKKKSQRTLFSFSSSPQTSCPESDSRTIADCAVPAPQGKLNAAWKDVFGCGPKAPPCSGHNEACVLRKVKKSGPNKDKQFWVCARPVGNKGDPLARCDYFKWVKK